jgi:hypothetical protein
MVACTFRENGVPRHQDGDTVANAETGGTRWAEQGVLVTLQRGLPVRVEGAAEEGENLVDHGNS